MSSGSLQLFVLEQLTAATQNDTNQNSKAAAGAAAL